MKFPCPECERPLAPDLDWEYCPYCGSLLHHSSRVAEWREVATYASFGAASFASDELMRRGIPTRVRAEISGIDTTMGGRPYHAVDVSAETYDEASGALAEFHGSGHDDEIEPDPESELNPIVKEATSTLVTIAILVFVAAILVAIVAGLASRANPDLFR